MIEQTSIMAPAWLSCISIRHLTAADLPALEWGGEYTHFRHVYAEAYQRMLKGLSILWGAELPGQGLVGQVFIQLDCDRPELADGFYRAYLYSFRVQPQYRGVGLGSLMMKVVEEDLCQRGFHSLTLNVAKDNLRAQKLYARHGYQIVAHEPGVWHYLDHQNNWRYVKEEAWRMEKNLLPESKRPHEFHQ